MNSILQEFGRKLRLGIIGGGPKSFIGPVHRMAARMSDCYTLTAAVLSSDPERSVHLANPLGISKDRAYPTWEAMLEAEKGRKDAIDVVAVMTPNDSHYPICAAFLDAGFHIICDKPLCNSLHHARDLVQKASSGNQIFCITYNYSAYPMVRQASAMVAEGIIGEIRQVHLTYVQGYLATRSPEEDQAWRLNPQKGGPSLVLGDIGTHAFHLGEYVAGLQVRSIMADVGPTVPGRTAHDYVSCLLRFENEARGSLWVTNAAAGAEHGLSFRIFGSLGGLEWHQEWPNQLRHRQLKGFEQIMTRRRDGTLSAAAESSTRLVRGHPEGYHDAFANLYREAAIAIAAKEQEIYNRDLATYPSVQDGARGVEFIFACLESQRTGCWSQL